MCGWQPKLYYPLLTCTIPETDRGEFLIIKHYTNQRLLYFTYLHSNIFLTDIIGYDRLKFSYPQNEILGMPLKGSNNCKT